MVEEKILEHTDSSVSGRDIVRVDRTARTPDPGDRVVNSRKHQSIVRLDHAATVVNMCSHMVHILEDDIAQTETEEGSRFCWVELLTFWVRELAWKLAAERWREEGAD